MLRIIRSNHVSALAKALASRLDSEPLGDPMKAEQIVVNHRGMARWLQHELALGLGAHGTQGAGICSMVEFPFPEAQLRDVCAWLRGVPPSAHSWSRQALTWSLVDLLMEYPDQPELSVLADYLRDEKQATSPRLLGISREIAATFDRYVVYRPELALSWAGCSTQDWPALTPLPPSEAWQPFLWRALRERLGPSPAENVQDALEAVRSGRQPHEDLPQRLSLFGVSFLPPTWLALLRALASRVEVDLYLLCASHHYLGDLPTRRQSGSDPEDDTPGLLRTLGRTGRDFQALLAQQSFEDETWFIDSEPRSALSILQADMLHMNDRGLGASLPPISLDEEDDSILMHRAPGLIRQVEVLRESLLHLLSKDKSLQPRDILIMSPDPDRFAPLVSAVFSEGGEPGGPPQIPIQVADQGQANTNPVAAALLALMQLNTGRVELSQVMELLASPVIAPRFKITADDLVRIRTWVEGAGICWGQDADHRAAHGQPRAEAHTWRYGLDRLLLGVAIQGPERLYGGLSPWDELEGGETEALGRFCDFCSTLFEVLDSLHAPRCLDAWMKAIDQSLDRMVALEDDDRWQLHRTHSSVAEWLCMEGEARPLRELSADGLANLLSRVLSRKSSGSGHQTGKATFCAMMPMRAIPFRVIALLGMDEGSYPRSDRGLGFDLIEQKPRLGDRVSGDEDRYLLLESILCAQQHLVITWSNRDPCTGRETAPAVPISELIDTMERSFQDSTGGSIGPQLIRSHPLHPYAPQSFGRGSDGEAIPPWSLDAPLLGAAQSLDRLPEAASPMLRESLDEMEPIESVELDTLIRVLQSPIAALLRSRLQISLWEDEAIPLDRETLELDGLAKWKSKNRLLKDLGRDLDSESMYIHQQAQGMLTPGTMGRVDFDVNQAKIEPVIQAIQAYQVPDIEQIAIDMEISGIHLTGSVGSIHGDTCLEIQAGRVKGKHQLAAWIRQLCLSAAIPERAFQTVMFWPDEKKTDGVNKLTLSPLGDLPEARQDLAKEHLNKLMALFVRARSEPLPLFSEAGLAYASRRASGKNDIVAMKDARKKWKEDRKQPLITHVFGAEAPLESVEPLGDFRELSESVFGPLCRAGGKSTG